MTRVKSCISRYGSGVYTVGSSFCWRRAIPWAHTRKHDVRQKSDDSSCSMQQRGPGNSLTQVPTAAVTTRQAYITIAIRLRYDYDTTTKKNRHVHFLLASYRIEWKQARAIRRSWIIVESNAYLNFDHFRRSRLRRGIVVL